MNLVESALILLLVGAFVLLIAVFFLIFFLPAVTTVNEPVPQTLELGEIFESKQLKISQTIPATQETSQFKTPRNFEKKIYYIESEI